MRNVAISVGVLILGLVIWVATRKPLSIDDELGKLPGDERQALEAIASEAGIKANQLKPVGIGVMANHPRAVAIEDGHVMELRISDAPIKSLAPIARLVGLKALWLDGTQLESLEGLQSLKELRILNLSRAKLGSLAGLAGHPAVTQLNLSHCGLDSVADVRDLPVLRKLDLSGNQVEDVASLTALPELRDIDLTDTLVRALPEPKPANWQLKMAEAPAAPAKLPDNWSDAEPKEHGEIKLGGRSGQVAADDDWLVEGTVKSVNGAGKVFGIPGMRTARGTNVALEIEAKSGKVRAYLESSVPDASKFLGRRLGYVYAEASPGKPGRAVGMLTRLTGSQFGKDRPFQFMIESVDGEAAEISYKLHRNKK